MVDQHKLTKKEKKELRKTEWQEKLEKEKRNALLKKAGIVIGSVVAVLITILVLINISGSSSTTSGITVPPVSKSDITRGNPKSKVTLIEYSDFQCPACAAYYPIVKQLFAEFGDKIFFAYRMFPLSTVHKNAIISAQAGYAAYKQGKFFEMEDSLFTRQTEWAELQDPITAFIDFAKLLKLDPDKFKTDMNSDEAKNYVSNSQNQASAIGINSTPSFFVNGRQITNPQNYDDFKKLIQDEINKK